MASDGIAWCFAHNADPLDLQFRAMAFRELHPFQPNSNAFISLEECIDVLYKFWRKVLSESFKADSPTRHLR